MEEAFVERLKRGPLLGDGAMGTQLYERGVGTSNRCLDELNLSDPDLVKAVHLDYIRAGAELIETNTFGANRMRLSEHRLEGLVTEINEAGVRIAREARSLTGQRIWIAGTVGPAGRPLAPLGPMKTTQAKRVFAEQVRALTDAGVDLLVLDTFTDLREIRQAIEAARELTSLPIVAHMTFNEDGATPSGDTPQDVVEALESLDVQAVGTNCSVGSEPMLRVVEAMSKVSDLPLSAQPNAGFPAYQDGRFIYRASPEYVADYARRMVESGAVIIGGCCGTSPDHLAAVRDALQGVRSPRARPAVAPPAKRQAATAAPSTAGPTGLAKKLGRKFAVTVEVDPPNGFDVSSTLETLSELRDSGLVDAMDVADNPRARSRMSALAMSSLIQTRLGMETVMHLALRHRNLVALHSELLSAHALGVRNVFVVMGDLPSTGDYPDATAIADITASDSIRLIKGFNSGVDVSGRPIEQATSFNVGCAFNMSAKNMDRELRALDKKLDAGADFMLTQPVYSAELVEQTRQRLGGFPAPVLLGVLPLRSERHAEFLHNEVPGMVIPDEVRERISEAGDGAAGVGVELSQDLLRDVYGSVAGAYFMPPFGLYSVVLNVLEGVKDKLGLAPGTSPS